MAWEDAFWEIHKEITELKLKKQFTIKIGKLTIKLIPPPITYKL